MEPEHALAALKYIGFLFAAASSTWALIAKTTYEDDHKRKRLTAAGYVSILIIVGSGLTSAIAYGFESVLKQAQAKNSADKAEQARRKGAEETARRAAEEDRREARRREESAESRAVAAEQRTLTLSIALEQRSRQLELSRQVNEGTRNNLLETGRALTEIGRVLQPIDRISIEIVWRLRKPLPLSADWLQKAAFLIQNFKASSSLKMETFCSSDTGMALSGGIVEYLEVQKGSCFFPEGADIENATTNVEA